MKRLTNKYPRKFAIFWKCLLLFFVVSILHNPSSSHAGKPVIRYFSYPEYTRVVIESPQELIFSSGTLSNPERIFIDINKRLPDLQKEIEIKGSIVKTIRTGFPEKALTRVVIDLNKKANYMIFTLTEPFRIVIDVMAKKDESELSTGQPGPASPESPPKEEGRYLIAPNKKPRIVLDPGHGGHDPGAIGRMGLKEKDVNLDIALRVRDLLKEDFEVFMTRENDVFISLDERTAFANSKNADLFVSIHTNSNRKRNVNGIETYFLNWTDDEEALKVAARENGISLQAMKNFSNLVDLIKMDLETQAKRDSSMILASAIHGELKNNIGRPSNGIKKGPFYVLYTAKMPCVLVEVSYISNLEEERLLNSSAYRESLAKAIANGIRKFFELKLKKNYEAI